MAPRVFHKVRNMGFSPKVEHFSLFHAHRQEIPSSGINITASASCFCSDGL